MKEQLKKADVLGLLLVASTLISYFVRSTWTNLQTGVVIAGGVLILVALVLKSNEIREGMGRRSTKFGINSAVSVLLLLGVLALVNYMGEQHQKRFDLTTERLHSLSDESVKVAAQVEQDVTVKAFFPGADHIPTRELLNLYSAENAKIGVQFIDPDKQPQAAEEYKVTVYGQMRNPMTREEIAFGTLILDMGEGKVERIEKQDAVTEEDVTNALMKLVKGETKTIYFVTGHGEKAIDNRERTGYEVASGELTRDGYAVKALNLAAESKVPEDASVVVIAGPVTEPFSAETDALDAYLNGGGSVLLMLDPPPSASMTEFTKKWSVEVGTNRIIDSSGIGQLFGTGPQVPLVANYGNHKIVERFNLMTIFPLARSASPAAQPAAGLTVEPLIETGENSWGESDLKSSEVRFDDKVDLKGPVPVATVVSKDAEGGKKTRLIVFGDSDFAMNAYFGAQGNGNLFTNTVKWLARDENFVSIQTKSQTDRPLTMTESGGRTVSLLVMVLFPGAVLFSGVLVWVRRRK